MPIINKPTRVTNHNVTIIDHILTNSFDSKIDTGILKVDITNNIRELGWVSHGVMRF